MTFQEKLRKKFKQTTKLDYEKNPLAYNEFLLTYMHVIDDEYKSVLKLKNKDEKKIN